MRVNVVNHWKNIFGERKEDEMECNWQKVANLLRKWDKGYRPMEERKRKWREWWQKEITIQEIEEAIRSKDGETAGDFKENNWQIVKIL